jgi:Glycosyl hydrolase catalytic core
MTATPTNLKLAPGEGSLAVSWGMSSTENLGGLLLHYRPVASPPVPWTTIELASTVRAYSITGLQAESYEVQIRALVAGGVATVEGQPLGTRLCGLNAGGWGPTEPPELKTVVDLVRLDTPSSIAAFTAAGLEVIADFSGPYNAGGIKMLDVASWVQTAAAFVKANPQVYALEVLNEPGGSWFWGANAYTEANAAAYVALLKAVRAAIGTETLILASFDGGHPESAQWGEWMLAADPDCPEYFDFPTAHAYGGTGERAKSALGHRDTIERIHELTGRQVCVTEFGWPTAFPAGDSLQWTEAQQAENLSSFISWCHTSGAVKFATFYGYRDEREGGGYGVQHHNGVRKPAWAVLANQT